MGYNDIIRIESSDGAQRVIDELTGLARNGGKVFRGYNKQDELLPSLIRDKVSYVTQLNTRLLMNAPKKVLLSKRKDQANEI